MQNPQDKVYLTKSENIMISSECLKYTLSNHKIKYTTIDEDLEYYNCDENKMYDKYKYQEIKYDIHEINNIKNLMNDILLKTCK